MSDSIAESLDMRVIEKDKIEIIEPEIEIPGEMVNRVEEKKFEEDLDFVRNNLKEVAEQASEVMSDFIEIAGQGQTAREFEVVSTIMKTAVDANKALMSYHEKKVELKPAEMNGLHNNSKAEEDEPLVMTTSELSKMIKNG